MNEHQVALACDLERALERAVVVVPVQHDLAAQVDHRLHLDVGRGPGHHDDGGNCTPVGGKRDALRVIAGRGAHNTALGDRIRKVRDPVVSATELEREHRLQILALQQHVVAKAPRQACGFLQR